ncbi:hypothetical protein OWV82_013256 [Melia azedarach]|uniref:Uncharacterized protein n=1 Tax=Melia azedarach TaxID=155640 RepID=A0ACC1XV91_MELAZ|nr:hypothetical protein OWV82_013256 [Melia azedarach]
MKYPRKTINGPMRRSQEGLDFREWTPVKGQNGKINIERYQSTSRSVRQNRHYCSVEKRERKKERKKESK